MIRYPDFSFVYSFCSIFRDASKLILTKNVRVDNYESELREETKQEKRAIS